MRLLESYEWKVGQSVTLGTLHGNAFTIAGTFRADGSALETRALAGRAFVQDALGKRGICNNIVVQVDEAQHADEVIRTIDETLAFPVKTHTKRERAFLATIAEEMADLLAFSRWVVLSTLLVVLLGVANTVSMSMRDRVAEVGVLRTLGFPRLTVLGLVLSEAAAVSAAGGLAAVPAVLLAFAALRSVLGDLTVRGVSIPLAADPGLLALAVPVAAAAGVLGGILPAFFASRRAIVDSFRAVDA